MRPSPDYASHFATRDAMKVTFDLRGNHMNLIRAALFRGKTVTFIFPDSKVSMSADGDRAIEPADDDETAREHQGMRDGMLRG